CIKIVGRANFSSSIDFKTVINELLAKGYRYYVLELSECVLMDSTFLGVLTGFGLKMNRTAADLSPIQLLNPNNRISDLLENLGVLHLFQVNHGDAPVTCTEQEFQTPANPTREQVTRACLEAHQTLMTINSENASKFKEVTQFLSEDLKKLSGPK